MAPDDPTLPSKTHTQGEAFFARGVVTCPGARHVDVPSGSQCGHERISDIAPVSRVGLSAPVAGWSTHCSRATASSTIVVFTFQDRLASVVDPSVQPEIAASFAHWLHEVNSRGANPGRGGGTQNRLMV